MITASDNLKNVLKQNSSIKTGVEATIEYNMNSLIDGITIVSATADSAYTSQISNWPSGKPSPFKKLFPVDSVIKPFRPVESGIKYFILPANNTVYNYPSPKSPTYDSTKPRIYYPGITTFYKYWVTPKGGDVDLTLTYKQTSSTYTGNKAALANKIVISFEKYHSLPTQYRVTVTPVTGSAITTSYFSTPVSGKAELYYNGTTWTTTAPSEPVSYSTPQSIKSMRLEATHSSNTDIIGVIEFSARWIKDVSSDIVSFNINKESSSSADGLLPVGTVTSNILEIDLCKYDQDALKYVAYNRDSTSFNSSLTYLAKNAEIKTYINVYHTNGAITSGSNKYDKLKQGTFYINEFSISEYGDSSITALDGAKYLIETVAPEILCEGYPVTAILRRLLDSVGFTSYNFNIKTVETSIPTIQYWWTDGTVTVWEAIQELCRDIQMNAFFDENNILQFYSRDYIYDSSSRSTNWEFFYDAESTTLPSIIDFQQKEIASANSVKVLWQTPLTSNYTGTSGPLWESPTSFLSAGSLSETILSGTAAASTNLVIDAVTVDPYSQQQSLYNFQGYVLIDSEIIEFDAIEYQYTDRDSIRHYVWITSQSDISKYRALSLPGYADSSTPTTAYFKPTGKYRVKTRGALGTTPANHYATALTRLNDWSQYTNNGAGSVGSIVSTPLNPAEVGKNKSYLTLTNNNSAAKSYSLVHRAFNAISVPSSTTTTLTGEGGPITVNTYSTAYHSFGTTLFIQPTTKRTDGKYPPQGGGVGFFVNSAGSSGYFVLIQTTTSASSAGQRTVQIVRMKNGVITALKDTQKTDYTTLGGIFSNQSYSIDIKTKISGTKMYITVYINGFKVTAVDEATIANGGLIAPTANVGLVCHLPNTTAMFDYAYGLDLTEAKYTSSESMSNIYQGQFSNDLIETSFGDIIYNANSADDGVPIGKTAIDEFGTVVREILKVNTKFDSRPSYPLKWTTGMNKFAKVLGSKVSNFGGEAYVLNNTSSTIPLSDGGSSNFYIYGNTIGQSGTLEYSTDDSADYANKEPVIFESKWLQALADVESLAKWIKNKVINRGKVITINVFGNPIISVGDIVTIKYPYQGLAGTEKLIVTNVSQSYSQGLETSIVCRTL